MVASMLLLPVLRPLDPEDLDYAAILTGLVAASRLLANTLTMRLMNALMAFPALLLALAVLTALGNSAGNVVVALSLVYVPRTARIVRAEALVTRELPYVGGARAAGGGAGRASCCATSCRRCCRR